MKRLFLLFSVAICLCGMNGCKSKQALAKPEKVDNYGKNTAVTDNIDVVNMYEEQAYSVIDQTLAGAELVGEKLYKLENGNYRYHVCLQVNKQYLADQLSKAFESEAVLQAKFDKAQFKKVYDEQMNAFLESQK